MGCNMIERDGHFDAAPAAARGLKRRSLTGLLLLTVFLGTATCFGDTLVLKDGRVFEGRLLRRTEKEVQFEVHRFGAKLTNSFLSDQVDSITEGPIVVAAKPETQPAVTGPTYLIIPVKGEVGKEVTASAISQCLTIAEEVKPDVVILEIDSPGGSVAELGEILKEIGKHKDLRFAAHINEAASAAAILTLSCKEICVRPTATLGGSVIYRTTPGGTPANIEEKMQSLRRAEWRAIVETAGHNPLLVEGMMRTDIVLGLLRQGDKTTVVEGSGDRVLKPAGRILTFTGKEAVECGVAIGMAETPAEMGKHLGFDSWQPSPAQGELDTIVAQVVRGKLKALALEQKDKETARARFSVAVQRAATVIGEAEANDPVKFTYTVDPQTGRFSPDAERDWRRRSDLCTKKLSEAESLLTTARGLAQRYPDLRLSLTALSNELRRIERLRQAIAADRKRRGIPVL